LNGTPNEWRSEYYMRRVIAWLGKRSATPHQISWGADAEELVLRYGWPIAWSRVDNTNSSMGMSEPSIVGHDPSPSFPFGAKALIRDTLSALGPSAWDLEETRAAARYAPPQVKRVGRVSAQFARFRRGDSTLVVAAFSTSADSLIKVTATLGAANWDDSVAVSRPDTIRTGRARVTVNGHAALVGVDISDTTLGTLRRTRLAYAPEQDSSGLGVSDVLLFRGEEATTALDSALKWAIPGDTATRNKPVGLFWETYGIPADGTGLDVAVSVERVDRSWIRSAKQRLRLTPVDTPIRMKWTEQRPSAGRSVSLDLTNLDAGRYRITVSLTREDGTAVSSTREVELINP
jgi:hypothetical protein